MSSGSMAARAREKGRNVAPMLLALLGGVVLPSPTATGQEHTAVDGRPPVVYAFDPLGGKPLFREDLPPSLFDDPGTLQPSPVSVAEGQVHMNLVQQLSLGTFWIVSKPAAFDLDHDGLREFVIRKYAVDSSTFYVFECAADDTFVLAQTLVAGPEGSATMLPRDVGDTDGDGFAELATSGQFYTSPVNTWSTQVYESISPLTYPTERVWEAKAGGFVQGVRIADSDSDGVFEIVAVEQVSESEHRLAVYENDGNDSYSLTYSRPFVQPYSTQSMTVTDDLDGDGRREILYGGLTPGSTKAVMVESVGDNAYAEVWSVVPLYQGQALNILNIVDCGDLDGDGRKEFLLGGLKPGAPFSYVLLLFEAVGDNQFEVVATFSQFNGGLGSGDNAMAADVDGDGKKEIVYGSGKTVRIYRNAGDNVWEVIWNLPLNVALEALGAGDHDADGKEEVLVFFGTGGDVWEIDPDDAADPDTDGLVTAIDNCPLAPNPGQENADGDQAGDVCDCAPGDGTAFAAPVEVEGLRFAGTMTLAWDSQSVEVGSGTVYDVIRGEFAGLPVGSSPELCLEPGSADTTAEDRASPEPGAGFYYLVRGANSCGKGTYGTDSSSNERVSAACR